MKKKNLKDLSFLGVLFVLIATFTISYGYQNNDSENTIDNSNELLVYFIDVGQADAIYIKDNDENMLIDAGNNTDGKLLVNYLKGLGVTSFKYVVGTHAHEDHIGGMDNIINNFKINTFYMPDAISTSKTFEDVLDALESNKVAFNTPKIGDTFNLKNAMFEVLSLGTDTSDLNDTSIVFKMTYNNTCTLFMGDASSAVEKNLLDKNINCDVLKVGHHGSKYSSSEAFIKAVKPTYGIIMVGKDNKYGHPTEKTLQTLQKYNVNIHRTDEEGTIIMKIKEDTISFESEKTDTNG